LVAVACFLPGRAKDLSAPRYTDLRCLTTGIRSEKCVVKRFRRCANVYLHKPRQYSLLHTYAIRYSLLLLGYKPVQHVTVLNTVGNCHTLVSIIILWDHRRIRGPSLTETSLCGAFLYSVKENWSCSKFDFLCSINALIRSSSSELCIRNY